MSFLKHNWVLKLMALALSIMLAVFVHREADVAKASFTLPLDLEPPMGQRVVEPMARTPVTVDLEGPAEMIRSITSEDLHMKVDISNARPGRRVSVPVDVSLPEKYDRVRVEFRPRSLQVRLESDATKNLPVIVKPLNPPEGWEMREAPHPSPTRVTVSGPRDVVDRVVAVVAPLNLEANERITAQVQVQALAADGTQVPDQSVRIEPAQVNVTGLQERVVLQKRVPVQPIFQTTGGARVTVESVSPSEVQIVGSKRLVGDIYVIETQPVRLGAFKGVAARELQLASPREGIEVSPLSVKVTFKSQGTPAPAPVKPR